MDSFLPKELLTRLKEIGAADIVVGIPSYNNARTIGHVVRAASAGLTKYFHQRRSIIVNSDGGSTDGTQQVALAAQHDPRTLLQVAHTVEPIQRISTPYGGPPGKGSAFRLIFGVARELNAKACVVVDSDLRSITPEWIELLAGPVLEHQMDFIAPYYYRHKYDGTITNSIIHPVTRAVFGSRVRQPIGGDFGFSGRLASRYLEKDVWESDVARFGVDIWMTVTAIAEDFRVGQSYLGAKLHDAKDPGADLTSMFRQVVGAVFALMETYEKVWQTRSGSEPVTMFGFPFEVGVEPIAVNVDRMIQAYHQGVRDLHEIYEIFLAPETLSGLQEGARRTGQEFRLPDPLWVRVIYEFAVAYHRRVIDRNHLMESLVPLYLGRTASFVLEVRDSTASEVERRIETLCDCFESDKAYLTQLWQGAAAKPDKEVTHAQPD